MAPTKVLAEYAKSGRSKCKGCQTAIVSGILRVGTSVKDPRGFDTTKWYHLDCFPTKSNPIGSVEDIKGVASLKSADKEALRILEAGASSSKNKKRDRGSTSPSNDSQMKKLKSAEKEALGNLDAGASSNKDEKRDRGSASLSNDSKMEKLKSADKEALGNLDAGASSNKDEKRDRGSASPSNDSQMEKLTSADKEALGNLDAGASSNKDEKRDRGSTSPLNDSQMKKLKSADKEALGSLDAGASSNKDKKRDRGGASPSNDSHRKKQKVSAETKDGQVKFSVSEIEDNYKDASLSPNWKTFQTVIFNVKRDGLHDSAKIAAFDFDGCLAKTNVKRIGADAWSLMYPSIPKKLQGLYNDGYKLVIFTNESNIDRWKNKRQVAVDSKIGRLENFIKRVEVPIQVFIACGIGDLFRKPSTGMWTLLKEHFNSGVAIDMHQSFYVGDAAGREKDHSDADVEFAKAIGLKFYVPEEYFDVK
ncbi:Poly [ADP-ribose] polymerase 1 [Rhynchospora pubera]|uniref:Poly [ADP-ribose] polymerase 1 n=1 Tax=Rhynchospora pubera TaxID=906938 RepID=A0AAV8DRM3_9POAL|nr:Poly [ADP-ribose] polymerase 1 [Rhynchospora pubera]